MYVAILKSKVIPWLKKKYPDEKFIFQQDGVPGHTSKVTQAFLTCNIPFWPAGLWPPSSPDLNSLDYRIWTHVDGKACAKPHRNVESLKRSITKVWNDMSTDFVIRMCKAFRPRLQKYINAGGDIFSENFLIV